MRMGATAHGPNYFRDELQVRRALSNANFSLILLISAFPATPAACSQHPLIASQVLPTSPPPPPMAPPSPPTSQPPPPPPAPPPLASPASRPRVFADFVACSNDAPCRMCVVCGEFRPWRAPGDPRAEPGGPGPVRWWCGGTAEASAVAVAAAGSRGALALALFAPRSISADVFEVVPGSYLGCPVELAHDLGCFEHAEVTYFHVVSLILLKNQKLKSPCPPLAGR